MDESKCYLCFSISNGLECRDSSCRKAGKNFFNTDLNLIVECQEEEISAAEESNESICKAKDISEPKLSKNNSLASCDNMSKTSTNIGINNITNSTGKLSKSVLFQMQPKTTALKDEKRFVSRIPKWCGQKSNMATAEIKSAGTLISHSTPQSPPPKKSSNHAKMIERSSSGLVKPNGSNVEMKNKSYIFKKPQISKSDFVTLPIKVNDALSRANTDLKTPSRTDTDLKASNRTNIDLKVPSRRYSDYMWATNMDRSKVAKLIDVYCDKNNKLIAQKKLKSAESIVCRQTLADNYNRLSYKSLHNSDLLVNGSGSKTRASKTILTKPKAISEIDLYSNRSDSGSSTVGNEISLRRSFMRENGELMFSMQTSRFLSEITVLFSKGETELITMEDLEILLPNTFLDLMISQAYPIERHTDANIKDHYVKEIKALIKKENVPLKPGSDIFIAHVSCTIHSTVVKFMIIDEQALQFWLKNKRVKLMDVRCSDNYMKELAVELHHTKEMIIQSENKVKEIVLRHINDSTQGNQEIVKNMDDHLAKIESGEQKTGRMKMDLLQRKVKELSNHIKVQKMTIASLTADNTQMDSENTQLRSNIEKIQNVCNTSELKSDSDDLKEDYFALNNEKLRKKIALMQKCTDLLESKLTETEQQNAMLAEQLLVVRLKLNHAQSDQQQASIDHQVETAYLEKEKQEQDRLVKRSWDAAKILLHDMDIISDMLSKFGKRYNFSRERFPDRKISLVDIIEKCTECMNELSHEILLLQNHVTVNDGNVKKLNKESNALQEELNERTAETERLKEEVSALQEKNHVLTGKNCKLTTDNADLQKKLEESTSKVFNLERSVRILQTFENNDIQDSRDKKLTILKEENEMLEKQLTEEKVKSTQLLLCVQNLKEEKRHLMDRLEAVANKTVSENDYNKLKEEKDLLRTEYNVVCEKLVNAVNLLIESKIVLGKMERKLGTQYANTNIMMKGDMKVCRCDVEKT